MFNNKNIIFNNKNNKNKSNNNNKDNNNIFISNNINLSFQRNNILSYIRN